MCTVAEFYWLRHCVAMCKCFIGREATKDIRIQLLDQEICGRGIWDSSQVSTGPLCLFCGQINITSVFRHCTLPVLECGVSLIYRTSSKKKSVLLDYCCLCFRLCPILVTRVNAVTPDTFNLKWVDLFYIKFYSSAIEIIGCGLRNCIPRRRILIFLLTTLVYRTAKCL